VLALGQEDGLLGLGGGGVSGIRPKRCIEETAGANFNAPAEPSLRIKRSWAAQIPNFRLYKK
jgi:hypothetical protein